MSFLCDTHTELYNLKIIKRDLHEDVWHQNGEYRLKIFMEIKYNQSMVMYVYGYARLRTYVAAVDGHFPQNVHNISPLLQLCIKCYIRSYLKSKKKLCCIYIKCHTPHVKHTPRERYRDYPQRLRMRKA